MPPADDMRHIHETDQEVDVILRLRQHPELFSQIERSNSNEFQLQKLLRESYPAELVRAAITLAELRRQAVAKFSRAGEMWLDRQGLEQSTHESVAAHKAARFRGRVERVSDLCSGIGSDTIALAQAGCQVCAVDLSAAAVLRTQLNAEVYEVGEQVETVRAVAQDVTLASGWVHIDPDRRSTHRRAVRLEDYEPSLGFLQELTNRCAGGAIKLSPASNFGGKFPECEIELVSLDGECKEATVWFGEARTEHDWRATILPHNETFAGNPFDYFPQVGPLGQYLFDPDPAIVRAGLVDLIVDRFGLQRLDAAEEYLTGDELTSTAALQPFRVLANLPNQVKQLRQYFREHHYGDVEVKGRHVPVHAEQIRKSLQLTGEGRATVIIARLDGKSRAIVAERVV